MNNSLQIKRVPYANTADLFAGDDVRVLYVGDIHGEIHRLHKLLAQMNFNSNRDVLISVGDIFDRGKQSLQTLQYFYGCDRDHIMSVMGNHEHTSSKLIRFGLPLKQWFTNGGGSCQRVQRPHFADRAHRGSDFRRRDSERRSRADRKA